MRFYPFLIFMLLCSAVLHAPAQAQSTDKDVAISMEEALQRASQSDKKILVDVYASWCPYCQRMHNTVYPSEEVQKAIEEYFYLVKIDIEGEDVINYLGEELTEAEFANALQNESVPTTYFLDDRGAIIGVQPGYLEAGVFSALLNFVGSDAFRSQTFQDYSTSRQN